MQINNKLEANSFCYTIEKSNMLLRNDEIRELAEIEGYCRSIQEIIEYTDDIWEVEVEKDVTFTKWLYCMVGQGSNDERRFLLELFSKRIAKTKVKSKNISISLGKYENCVYDVQGYVQERRKILESISDPSEFGRFMPSCFSNSIFADNIISEMKNIKNFSNHTKEIVSNLSVLNDEGILLYKKFHNNLKEAMNILGRKLLECVPDNKNVAFLKFKFSYEDDTDGENIVKYKDIVCSPHLKLIHKGSDLRIYFQWCDKDIGNDEKVLVGRIGSHPY